MQSKIKENTYVQKYIEQKFDVKVSPSIISIASAMVWDVAIVALKKASQITKAENRTEVTEADLEFSIKEILTGEMLSRMRYISREFHEKFPIALPLSTNLILQPSASSTQSNTKPIGIPLLNAKSQDSSTMNLELHEIADMLEETQLILTSSQELQLIKDLADDYKYETCD